MKLLVEQLSKSYRDADRTLVVLNSLSYSFPEGQSIAIVGRSGVGKSTLLQILGGLDKPSSGRVLYGEHDLGAMEDEERSAFRGQHIGFIFQFHHLLPEFTALENTAMPLFIRGIPKAQAQHEAEQILRRVGLSHRQDHLPGELSGGEQQRVAIARAIVTKPAVILADEPTGNLDFQTADDIQKLLLEINHELKNTLVVVTHNLELARSLDQVVEMLPGGDLVRPA